MGLLRLDVRRRSGSGAGALDAARIINIFGKSRSIDGAGAVDA